MPIRYLSGLSVDSTVLVVDAANDRVGIGTASPAYKLDVVGSFRSNALFTDASANAFWGNGNTATAYGLLTWDSGVARVYATSGNRLEIGSNGSTVVTLSTTGNVGIGTTAPAAKLQVEGTGVGGVGTISIKGANAHLGMLSAANVFKGWTGYFNAAPHGTDNDLNIKTGYAGTSNIRFSTDGDTTAAMMILTSAGNVGIGTASPAFPLTVYHATNSAATFQTSGTGTGAGNGFYVGHASNISYVWNYNNFPLVLATNNTERVRVTEGGNVGIGTTAPEAPLHVYKSDTYSAIISRADWSIGTSTKLALGKQYGVLGFISSDLVETTNDTSYIALNYKSGLTTYAEGLRVYNNGNVGIGTTSPAYKLTVDGDSSEGAIGIERTTVSTNTVIGALNFTNNNGGTVYGRVRGGRNAAGDGYVSLGTGLGDNLYAIEGGNVGIGTTSPSVELVVYNSSTPRLHLQNSTSGTTATDGFQIALSGTVGYLWNWENGATLFGTNNAERMRITSAGNVGIGTTSPATALHVYNSSQGVARFESTQGEVNIALNNSSASGNLIGTVGADFYFYSGGSERMRITSGGQLLINATSSAYPTFGYNLGVKGISTQAFISIARSTQTLDSQGLAIGVDTSEGAIYLRDNLPLSIYTNNTFAMRVAANGNVGIGTTSPTTAKLVISQTGGTQLHLISGDSSGSTDVLIRLTSGIDYRGRGILMDNSGASGSWYAGVPYTGGSYSIGYGTTQPEYLANSKFFINTSGNVGIGTTSPSEILEASRSTNGDIAIKITNSSTGASAAAQFFASNGTNQTQFFHTGTSYTGPGVLTSAAGLGGLYNATVQGLAFLAANASGAIKFATGTGNDERMRITSAGNVGIGTTSPAQALQVVGNAWINRPSNKVDNASCTEFGSRVEFNNAFVAGSTGYVVFNYPAASVFRIYADYDGNLGGLQPDIQLGLAYLTVKSSGGTIGNVGIGTTAPMGPLEVYKANSGGLGGHIVLNNNGLAVGNETAVLFNDSGVGSVASVRAAISSTVEGSPYAGDIKFKTGGGAYASLSTQMIIKGNGNVGIGTTSPGAKLHNYSTATSNVFISGYGTAAQNDWGGEHAFFVNANNGIIIGKANAQNDTNRLYTFYNDAAGNAEQYIYNTSNTATIKLDSAGDTYFNGGNVGIGTTGPTEKLHVDGSTLITYNNSFQSTNSVGNKAILARVSPTSGIINYAEYATATNLNGFVIGSDDARVKGNITGDSLEFITNTSTRMTILSGGNVGINTTTPGSTLHVIGDVLIQTGALGVGVSPNATDGRIDASNDIVAFSTSDRRLKENITPIANALEKVKSLTGVEFDWKEETKSVHGYEGHDVGIIAQDVQAVLPEAVRTNDSGYLSVRYEKMIALLVEANKELADRVEQLEKLIK